MQGNTEDKDGIQHDASAGPVTGRRLGILVVELRNDIGSARSAGARRHEVAYLVTVIAPVSGRETRREKIHMIIALEECMNSSLNKQYSSPNVVWWYPRPIS